MKTYLSFNMGISWYIPILSLFLLLFSNNIYAQPCTIGGYESCDDGDPCTLDDVWDQDCIICMGYHIIEGEPCDDGDSLTINDQYDNFCSCIGTFFCEVNTPCDDNDPNTVNDRRVSTDCTCKGTPLPCTIESGLFAKDTIAGCTNPLAVNYDPNANYDNGTCQLGKISGVVWRDRNKDGIKDAGETRQGGKKVYLMDVNSNILDSTVTTFGNSIGGVYEFADIPTPNTYIIKMETPVRLCPISSSYVTIRTYDIDGTLDDQTTQILNAGDCYLLHDFGYDCVPPPPSGN